MANTKSTDLESGSSQYWSITDGDQTGLDITGDITIECWIKLESIGADVKVIASKWSGNTDTNISYDIEYHESLDKITFNFSPNGTGASQENLYSDVVNFTTGVWYHIAVTFDASTSTAIFYIDGSSVNSDTGSATSIYNGTAPFVVGARLNNGSSVIKFFDGLIDEVRVWNDIRTTSEISDNYQTELAGTETGLAGYWKFNDDGTDSQTAGNNDLTNNNTATFSSDVPNWSTTSIKSINGLAYASVKSKNGLAIADIKSINGLA